MKKNINNKNIVIVTGGTGGHINPAVTVGQYFIQKLLSVNFITDKRGLVDSNLSKFNPTLINVKGFAGKNLLQKVISILLIVFSILKSLIFLINKKTDLVLGFGSYVQVPVILAAKILNIKIILHEANMVLGNANKYLWKFARIRSSAFNIINSSKNFHIVGMPVRKQVQDLFKRKYEPHKKNKKINLLILGGSLGASILSRNLSNQICLLPKNLKNRLHIVHQAKTEDIKYIKNNYRENNISYEVEAYFIGIHKKFKNTTLVICRAGASTMAENLTAGLPAIYIPLSNSIDNHQKYNAEMIKNNNAGYMILEEELLHKKFVSLILKLLKSDKLLKKISKNCKKISNPHATENLYELTAGVLNE